MKADSSEARKTTASAISFASRGGRAGSGVDWRFKTGGGAVIARAGQALRQTIAGLGIALLPMFLAGDAIESKRLRVIEIGVQAEAEFIYIAHPEDPRPSAKLRTLADHLRTAVGTIKPLLERMVELRQPHGRRYRMAAAVG